MAGEKLVGWRGRALTVGILVGLLATSGVDVAVAGHAKWQAHERAVARKHRLEQQNSYLAGLRQLDIRIGRDIAPTMLILKALATPKPADVFAARDAFASSTAETALAGDLAALGRLHPPSAWAAAQKAQRHAVEEMHDAIAGMRKDRDSRNFDFLANDLQSNRGGALASGVVDWQDSIRPLFRQRHQKAPSGVAGAGVHRVPATVTSWVFGIDRACIASRIRDLSAPRSSGSIEADLAGLRTFAANVAKMVSDLRRVPVPQEQAAAIRRDVISRLTLFDSEVRALRAEADQLTRRDFNAARLSVDRMKTLEGAVPLLDRGFRRYHAYACGGDPSAKRRHPVAT